MTGERLGIPSVAVITEPFVDGCEVMAQAMGIPGYQFAVIDHPISHATLEQLAERATLVLAQAQSLLGIVP